MSKYRPYEKVFKNMNDIASNILTDVGVDITNIDIANISFYNDVDNNHMSTMGITYYYRDEINKLVEGYFETPIYILCNESFPQNYFEGEKIKQDELKRRQEQEEREEEYEEYLRLKEKFEGK